MAEDLANPSSDEEGLIPHELVPQDYKLWFREDLRHAQKWRDEARVCYDFVAGEQWDDKDKAQLEEQQRPTITFNRIGVIVDAVVGSEIGNRKEVRFIPREMGDVQANEGLTSTAQWFRDQGGADDEDTEAFADAITAGMGWTETRLDYDDNPDGDPVVERIDPFEMVWDYASQKKNLMDARRVWRVKDFPIAEARALFPEFDDEELHAEWANSDKDETNPHVADKITNLSAGKRDSSGNLKEVTIVHCQYVERVPVWRVMIPAPPVDPMQMMMGGAAPPMQPGMPGPMAGSAPGMGGMQMPMPPQPKEATLTEEEYSTLIQAMPDLQGVRQWKKVRKQAFFGNVVLAYGDTPCPDEFNFQCITGKRDRNKGQWFGLVRSMIDPQRWANKWLSQLIDIMNTNAKGGIMAERSAFENPVQAEDSWATPRGITWMRDGALSGQQPKVQPKPMPVFPSGHQYLTEMAVSSIRDVSGVSLELLGMRETNQPGVLEYQRRQAGMTILQPLFDSLKLYRQNQGRLMLYYIQNDLADGRLVQIMGEQGAQYVPLMKQASKEYDIIVDDSPNSPNNKEMTWQLISQILPNVKEMLSPEIMLKLLEQSPLPSAVVEDIKSIAAKPNPVQEMMQQVQARLAQVEIQLKEGQAQKAQADAVKAQAEAQRIAGQPPGGELAIEREKMMAEQAMNRESMMMTGDLERQRATQDMQLNTQKTAADILLQTQKTAADIALAEKKAAADAQIKRETAKQTARAKATRPSNN